MIEFLLVIIIIIFILILNTRDDRKNNKLRISFKESLDLVGLPIITFKQGDKKFNFLLDTGANESVLNRKSLECMEYNLLPETGIITGLEGSSIETQYASVHISYDDKIYTENFQVLDMQNAIDKVKEDSGVSMVGILGNNFFQKYKYILDFDKLQVYAKK